MIDIGPRLEGELLIRSILRRRIDLNSTADVLRIHAESMPCPTVPQIAAKTGFQQLEILTGDSFTSGSAPEFFKWHGIDGTQINTRVLDAEKPFEGDAIDAGGRSMGSGVWYGELPAVSRTSGYADERECSRAAPLVRETEFFAAIRPSGLMTYSAAQLGAEIDTRGLKRPVLVINNNSFYANEVVAIPLTPGEKPVTAIGPEGAAEPVQILDDPHGDGINYALFVAKNTPLHGYAVWDLGATLSPTQSDDEVTVSTTHLENSSIRIEFDHATGLIVKIYDKDNERDILNDTFEVQRNGKRDLLLDSCANLFELAASGEAPAPITHLDAVQVIEAGPVRAAIGFTRTLPGGRSTIRQSVRLTARSTRIDFVTEVTWNEVDTVLSVAFPVAINSSRASYEIPLGYVERPTYHNVARTPGLYEADTHDWVDLSEGDYGVALLNDGRYGCGVRGSTLRLWLSVMRPTTDSEGSFYRFVYSLLPHAGDLRDGEVIENSNAVNRPPLCIPITGNRPGTLPYERSFFEVDSASIFIESIKPAEKDEKAIIVRLNETHNTRGIVLLTTTLPVKSAWLCDLLENNLAEIPLDNDEALLPFHPFEIITVKYTLCN